MIDTVTLASRYVVPAELWPLPAQRSMDAAHFNRVANDPTVRPFLGGEGAIDLSGILANPAHVGLATEHGGFVFVNLGESRYEVHSMFLPEGRGHESFGAMRAAQHYMFGVTDCVEGLTKVADGHVAASALAERAGFQQTFTGAVDWGGGVRRLHAFYSLTLQRWALRSSTAHRLGEWFHTAIEAVKLAHASTLPEHSAGDETAHNSMVGAAMLMLRVGHARKAEQHYNRWALFAGYPLMRVLTEHPIILDLDGIIVEAQSDSMEILSCL